MTAMERSLITFDDKPIGAADGAVTNQNDDELIKRSLQVLIQQVGALQQQVADLGALKNDLAAAKHTARAKDPVINAIHQAVLNARWKSQIWPNAIRISDDNVDLLVTHIVDELSQMLLQHWVTATKVHHAWRDETEAFVLSKKSPSNEWVEEFLSYQDYHHVRVVPRRGRPAPSGLIIPRLPISERQPNGEAGMAVQ